MNETRLIDIAVYDINGKKLIPVVEQDYLGPDSYNIEVRINSLLPGTYYCVFNNGNNILNKSFIQSNSIFKITA